MDIRIIVNIIGLILIAVIGVSWRIAIGKEVKLANKIAALVQEKKYNEAIELSKSEPKLDGLALMHLGAAYYSSGNTVKAKEVINRVRMPFYYSSSIKKSLEDWKNKVNS